MERRSPWSDELLELMQPRRKRRHSAKAPPPKTSREPRCVLDMECYRAGDRPFVLGILTLATCPSSPAQARDYVDALLATRRALEKATRLGIQVTRSRASRGAEKEDKHADL